MCDYCSWIEKILRPKIEDLPSVCTNILNEAREDQSAQEIPKKYEPTILVHGTADSASSTKEINATLENIEKAAVKAYKELAKDCEALEAVETAIRSLENIESNQDSGGSIDMTNPSNFLVIRDAALMDSESNAGAVGATTDTLHPITLAKKVLRENVHVLIVESGIRILEMSSNDPSRIGKFNGTLPTPPNSRSSRVNDIDESKSIKNNLSVQRGMRVYGSVARDRKGRLACGISTQDDRADSIAKSSMTASGSVLGCGIFSNGESCCSVSSEDRAVYLYAPARKIIERLQRQQRASNDSNSSLRIEHVLSDELNNFFKDTGESCVGAAALTVNGEAEVAFTSNYFPWACCKNRVITSGYIRGEVFEKDVGELDMPLDCRCDSSIK